MSVSDLIRGLAQDWHVRVHACAAVHLSQGFWPRKGYACHALVILQVTSTPRPLTCV